MLTRKQKWRRCIIYKQQFKMNNQIPKIKVTEKPSFVPTKKYNELLESDSEDEDQVFYDSKHVNFRSVVNVILIPARNEYKDKNLSDFLWYRDDEYLEFRRNYSIEMEKKYHTI